MLCTAVRGLSNIRRRCHFWNWVLCNIFSWLAQDI